MKHLLSTVMIILVVSIQLPAEEPASKSVHSVLEERTNLSPELKTAMETVVRQHPDSTRWSGVSGNSIFGIVAVPFKDDSMKNRLRRPTFAYADMLAANEVISSKGLLDRFEQDGLTDATTLQKAVGTVLSRKVGNEKSWFESFFTSEKDHWIVAVRIADRDKIVALMAEPKKVDEIRIAYRNTMHLQAREMMKRKQWQDALGFWNHLHHLRCVSPSLYLDAARCFMELERNDEAFKVLKEAFEAYAATADSPFFENLGDMLLRVETPEAQQLAQSAFEKALKLFQEENSNGL